MGNENIEENRWVRRGQLGLDDLRDDLASDDLQLRDPVHVRYNADHRLFLPSVEWDHRIFPLGTPNLA
jgi:hypothetical protein